ncbi:glycosyltransferase family 2 protein [Pantoea sp. Mhis]|uniref:glycosyltransferase family 2 protein n=1 Tax=Pantoea sp. Mhis TaxID=2576759 RepID=UPI0013593403|nr:glycosyltransferase family 2 protein [Pantoea sp. Mhis]MXP56653.1 glycosyltransferase family 2 protein [Pantoea sp. Mhis]
MLKPQLLSIVMIVKNEAELLPNMLDSVIDWANEIVILDCGSNDKTYEIALSYGVKVYQTTEWLGFGKQRQYAQTLSTGDMILMIDADERITPKLRHSIQEVLKQPQPNKVYSFRRKNIFLGYCMKYSGWNPDEVIRLYPRSFNYNNNLVHESLDIKNALVILLHGDLEHFTCRDLNIFQHKQLNYAKAWAEDRFQSRKYYSFLSIFNHMLGAFLNTLLIRRGILDGKRGWILAIVNAQYTFNKYSALWCLYHNSSRKDL